MQSSPEPLTHLSLFTGLGGEALASQHLLSWQTLGYVEINDYRQRIIRARQDDGFLQRAPIFSNIAAFNDQGYAAEYRGVVDVLTAGFPCQAWAACGKHERDDDERNLWPETRNSIRLVRPRSVLLENSINLVNTGFIRQIIVELSELGYVGRYAFISGLHAGAVIERKRVWIMAALSESFGDRLEGRHGCITQWLSSHRSIPALGKSEIRLDLPDSRAFRNDHDTSARMERLAAIGDAQIPRVAALAWKILG